MTSSLGEKTKALRTIAGLSQQALADKAGLAKITVGRIERGETSASLATLEQIAKALGVDVVELLPRRRRAS